MFSMLHIFKHMVMGAMIKAMVVEGARNNPMFLASCRDGLDASSFQGPSLASVGFWLGLDLVVFYSPKTLLQVEGAWENPSCWLGVPEYSLVLYFLRSIGC